MHHRSSSLSVFGRSAKFVSRSVEEMFELVASSMDECLKTAKRSAHYKTSSPEMRRRPTVLSSGERGRTIRPN
jgi:hypothetical protein